MTWSAPVLLIADGRPATGAGPAAAGEARDAATGAISGKITYRSDPKRPWRLGRYYIQSSKTGELAEAVVALTRRGLTGPADGRQPETVTIDQKDYQFTPETVAIRAGDSVKFLNHDSQVHNVQTSHVRLMFNVNMPVGGEHLERFAAAGGVRQPYKIGCAFHGAMHAWVFVFDHPWYAATGKDGAFRLDKVPPGEYRLDVVHPAGDLRVAKTITVEAGATSQVDFELTPDDRPPDQNSEPPPTP